MIIVDRQRYASGRWTRTLFEDNRSEGNDEVTAMTGLVDVFSDMMIVV